jgi:hypothetical protein
MQQPTAALAGASVSARWGERDRRTNKVLSFWLRIPFFNNTQDTPSAIRIVLLRGKTHASLKLKHGRKFERLI